MAGTLVISTLSDGTNSTSATNPIQGSAKAWVNFNGTTSPGTIRSQYNVSSVTKNGTGDYTINFTNALSDVNYVVAGTAGVGAVSAFNSVIVGNGTASMATGSCRINTRNLSGPTLNDVDQIQFVAFR